MTALLERSNESNHHVPRKWFLKLPFKFAYKDTLVYVQKWDSGGKYLASASLTLLECRTHDTKCATGNRCSIRNFHVRWIATHAIHTRYTMDRSKPRTIPAKLTITNGLSEPSHECSDFLYWYIVHLRCACSSNAVSAAQYITASDGVSSFSSCMGSD